MINKELDKSENAKKMNLKLNKNGKIKIKNKRRKK